MDDPVVTASVRLTPACAFDPVRFREPEPFASPAVGVGHVNLGPLIAASGSDGLFRPSFVLLFPSRAIGVGQLRATVYSDGVPALGLSFAPPFPLMPFCELPYSLAVGVGQQEESFALVRRADVGCAYTIPDRIHPDFGKVFEYAVEAATDDWRDVLGKDKHRAELSNNSSELEPER